MEIMNLTFKKDIRCFKNGASIPIEVGKVNYWVGINGSGKSFAAQTLLSLLKFVQPDLVPRKHWLSEHHNAREYATLEAPTFTKFFFNSDKSRQTQQVDMDALLEGGPSGVGRLWLSEGQNNIAELNTAQKAVFDPSAFVIFDETDGKLDFDNKVVFFSKICENAKSTMIVVTHDSRFLVGKTVFDFTTLSSKTGDDYYKEREKAILKEIKKAEKVFASKKA